MTMIWNIKILHNAGLTKENVLNKILMFGNWDKKSGKRTTRKSRRSRQIIALIKYFSIESDSAVAENKNKTFV